MIAEFSPKDINFTAKLAPALDRVMMDRGAQRVENDREYDSRNKKYIQLSANEIQQGVVLIHSQDTELFDVAPILDLNIQPHALIASEEIIQAVKEELSNG